MPQPGEDLKKIQAFVQVKVKRMRRAFLRGGSLILLNMIAQS